MKFLCSLGLHKWEYRRFVNPHVGLRTEDIGLRKCKRCELIQKGFVGFGGIDGFTEVWKPASEEEWESRMDLESLLSKIKG